MLTIERFINKHIQQNNMRTLADVKGLGKIVQAGSDFYHNLLELKKAKAGIITPRDEAYARLQTRNKENIGRNEGTYTTAGFEYVKHSQEICLL